MGGSSLVDSVFTQLPALIPPGDLVVLNTTRVRHARLTGRRASGASAEVLLIHPGATGTWVALGKPGTALRPLLHGGGQERGLRSGTLPAAAIAGFGAAAEAALADRRSGAATALTALRSRLLAGLRALAPELEVNGDPDPGLPGLLSVRFPGRRAEDLLLLLDRHGVACSAGSACASGAVTPSHVLVAMGRGAAEARETVRFSLGHASAEADVDAAVAAVGQALQVLAPGGSEGGRLVDQEAAR
mgnify:CR=1 FL=1